MVGWNDRPAYTTGLRIRAARRFRQQLYSPRHPDRRIHRVYRCVNWRVCGQIDVQTEAHHLDYTKPYVVVWVCRECHRRIDHDEMAVKPSWVRDYTSLVRQVPARHAEGDHLPHRLKEEVPF